jgi:protein ImuB
VPMQERSVLLKLLHLRLASHALSAPVMKVKLSAAPVAPRHEQEGLFVPDAPVPEKLEVTLARVAKVVGTENSGSPELLDSHRPQAFRMAHFTPPAAKNDEHSPASAKLALRLFRPAKKARVMVRDGVPMQVRFAKIDSEVLMAAGPWRACGEWWGQQPWARDEWDVALPEGLYRLVRDRVRSAWLVEGTYD